MAYEVKKRNELSYIIDVICAFLLSISQKQVRHLHFWTGTLPAKVDRTSKSGKKIRIYHTHAITRYTMPDPPLSHTQNPP